MNRLCPRSSLQPLRLLAVSLPLVSAAAFAQQPSLSLDPVLPASPSAYSSSLNSSSASDLPPAPPIRPDARPGDSRAVYVAAGTTRFTPFQAFGLSLKVGSGGVGFDVTTPLAPRLALRSGASFFSYNASLVEDGLNITGALKLQNASAGVDFFPFRNSFRISPGMSFANQAALHAAVSVPGGQSFSLGNGGESISSPSDPIRGTADFSFGHSIAPRLTVGWANAIPHRNPRYSFPIEAGFQYISTPTVNLTVSGSACGSESGYSGCGPVDQTYVQQEQAKLQNDISSFRVYPIVSLGFTYWFGHVSRNQ